MSVLDRLTRERALVIATHDRNLLGDADRVFSLRSGHLQETSAEEVLAV